MSAEISKKWLENGPRPPCTSQTAGVVAPGLKVIDDFITGEEEEALLNYIDSQTWTNELTRRTQHYGYKFAYTRLDVGDQPLSEIPLEFDGIRTAVLAAGLVPFLPDQITVNEYIPGRGIGAHVDTHSAFEDGIASITLSGGCVMELLKVVPFGMGGNGGGISPTGMMTVAQKKDVYLYPRSICCFLGESRYGYHHKITSRKTDCVDSCVIPRSRRVSITLRKVRANHLCNCAWPRWCDSQNPSTLVLPTRLK